MTPDESAVFAVFVLFTAHTLYVTRDNILALIAWLIELSEFRQLTRRK